MDVEQLTFSGRVQYDCVRGLILLIARLTLAILTVSAQVRKGEKASTVVKHGTVERENDQGEDKKIPYTKAYRVFNTDQIDGLPEAFYHQPEPPRDLGTLPDPALDDFFASFGVPIDTTDKPQAFYNPQSDRIHMPPISTFYEAVEYYGTLAHECAHNAELRIMPR